MSKIVWNPAAIHAPLPPALVSCGTMERSNIITIAWTGIINTIPPMTYISVRPERYSYPILCETGEFVINLTTTKLVRAADFCGVSMPCKGASQRQISGLIEKDTALHSVKRRRVDKAFF